MLFVLKNRYKIRVYLKSGIKQLLNVAALMIVGVAVLFLPRLISESGHDTNTVATELSGEGFPVSFKDAVGREVTVPNRPERTISFAPSLTEIAFFLEAGDRLVGRSKFDLWPEAAKSVPVVGDLNAPQIERILALKPDLILTTKLTPREVVYQFEQLRLNVAVFEHAGIDGTLIDMRRLARILGTTEESAARLNALTTVKASIEAINRSRTPESRPRTLLLLGVEGNYSAGTGTFPSEIIELAGGKNVADNQEVSWPQLSLESIVKSDPEVILIAEDDNPTGNETIWSVVEEWKTDPIWKNVSAIRSGRVHILNDSVMTIPGPRMIEAAATISRFLFPEPTEFKQP